MNVKYLTLYIYIYIYITLTISYYNEQQVVPPFNKHFVQNVCILIGSVKMQTLLFPEGLVISGLLSQNRGYVKA